MNVDSWGACLEWLADRLASAHVHVEQDPAAVRRAYRMAVSLDAPEGRDPGEALAVLLAAWASPDRPVEARSRWLAEQAWDTDVDAEVHHIEARRAAS